MKRAAFALVSIMAVNVAFAYEFHLQFSTGSNARSVSVVGYGFDGSTVSGDCSYDTVSACSGRGCHPVTTHHYNTCTWDLAGNLLSVTTGEPPVQPPLYTSGTEVVYAVSGSTTTGRDTRGFAFVDTPAAHYSWQTANGAYAVIPDSPYIVSATFVSDGDVALAISPPTVAAQIYGTVTPSAGAATVVGTTCQSSLPPNATCTVTVRYDPTAISCTASPYGYAYTGIAVSLSTNSPASMDFTERFTVTGVPVCDEPDGPPAAGVVPDGGSAPGAPLTVESTADGSLVIQWSASCSETDTDYEVYEGTLGDFSSHVPLLCTTGGATTATVTPAQEDSYYLVVPRNAQSEGSYGQDSVGERPQGLSSCLTQVAAPCQ